MLFRSAALCGSGGCTVEGSAVFLKASSRLAADRRSLDSGPRPFARDDNPMLAVLINNPSEAPLYRERGANQPSMCGQVCFAAPLPAMIPMWPPLTWNNSLSRLLTSDIIGSDWHDGVMWSS